MRRIRSGSPITKNFDNYLLCAYNGDMNKDHIASYVAGIFDGEGYIGIDKVSVSSGKNRAVNFGIRIVISQKDGSIMDFLQNQFGGNVYKQRNGKFYIYRWRIHSKKAQEFLITVYPFLIIKKEQAKFAIDFHEEKNKRYELNKIGKDGRYKPILEEENNWRIGMKLKLSKMKKEYKPFTKGS